MPENYDPRATSVAVGGRKKRGGWLWWLLGLLLLIILAVVLSSGNDNDDAGTASTPATTPATQTGQAAPTSPEQDAGAAAATTSGTLTAASVSLLADGAASIKDQVGQTATGDGLKVLSVDGSGFFVGTGDSDRQFVEFGDRVGGDEADAYQAKVGDTVSLSGPVRPAPADPAKTLKLGDEAAQAVRERGAYINADTVTPAG